MKSTLDKLDINKSARVISIGNTGEMKDRFLDIGLTNNTLVKCVLNGSKNEINGYEIRGAVIAIRKEDAEKVRISTILWVSKIPKESLPLTEKGELPPA